jgi:hypothetical protein
MHKVEISIMGTEHAPGVIRTVERITDSVSVSVERQGRADALAYALDFLARLSGPLDAHEQQGRTEDAVPDADAQVALARRITANLGPLIAEIVADPVGEWGAFRPSTMERLYANIVKWVTEA